MTHPQDPEYFVFKNATVVQFCRMSMISLKGGNYSGSNGGIFVDLFQKTRIRLLLEGV
jgi:hypothetical protein